MVDQLARLVVVDSWDTDDLVAAVGDDFRTLDEVKPAGAAGEPVTIMLIALGYAACAGLSAWLLKNRSRKYIELEGETDDPDGHRKKFKIKVNVTESQTDAEVVRQLAGLFPAEYIEQFLAGLGRFPST